MLRNGVEKRGDGDGRGDLVLFKSRSAQYNVVVHTSNSQYSKSVSLHSLFSFSEIKQCIILYFLLGLH
jgi:hypothetical protein